MISVNNNGFRGAREHRLCAYVLVCGEAEHDLAAGVVNVVCKQVSLVVMLRRGEY